MVVNGKHISVYYSELKKTPDILEKYDCVVLASLKKFIAELKLKTLKDCIDLSEANPPRSNENPKGYPYPEGVEPVDYWADKSGMDDDDRMLDDVKREYSYKTNKTAAERKSPASTTEDDPKKLEDYFVDYSEHPDDVLKLIEKIATIIPKNKPKDAASIFWVLYESEKIFLSKPRIAHTMFEDRFGNIGSRSGFSKYFYYGNDGLKCTIEANFLRHYHNLILKSGKK